MKLNWVDTGIGCTDQSGISIKAFTYGPLVYLRYSSGFTAFFDPDGKRYATERGLVNHMDKTAAKNERLIPTGS